MNEYGAVSHGSMEMMQCQMEPYYTIEANEEPISLELIPCPTCSRTFGRQTLEKHIRICEKMTVKKRKVFDSSRQRREGTELASYPLPKNYGLPAVKHERGISPKPIQAAPPKKPPEETNKPLTLTKSVTPLASKKLPSPSTTSTNLLGAPTVHSTTVAKERSRAVAVIKRIQPPPAEKCPYCERCFGVKAYDRHVEWCKEKALIASIKQNSSNSQVVAKERLEARIKYRAPCLKTKRSVNRDKYSGQNDENYDMQASFDENHQKESLMTSSMTSSFMSDGGVSDIYDPFLSAKRQLEELCSPSSPTEGTLSSSNLAALSKSPTNSQTSGTSNKMTTSFTSRATLTNPRRVVTTPKSNFHRTSSLRAPRRSPLPMSSRPIFFPSQKQRPTIQRGLSDEGPISSNFLKPEEYDEMPVRAVCVNDFAISNTPRVNRRDSNSASNRKNLRLNLPSAGQSIKDGSPSPSIGVVNSNLLKTDSLAVFLKYENEAKGNENSVVNTKELKDKSNTLSKQNSAKSVNSADDKVSMKRMPEMSQISDKNISNRQLNTIKLEPIVRSAINTPKSSLSDRQDPLVVESPNTSRPIKLNSIFDRTGDSDYIDPKLINVCDNLPMELGNDLASNSSSSPSCSGGDRNNCDTEKFDRTENMVYMSCSSNSSPSQLTIKKDLLNEPLSETAPIGKSCTNSNRSSGGDNRNQLKRKIRLGRNQFLYDASPEALDNDADDEGNNRSSCEHERRKPVEQTSQFPTLTHTAEPTSNIPPFSPSNFDEFDFEEFLSAFDNDDEQFPSLFKDCRDFLMNRSTINKRSNVEKMSSHRSANEMLGNSAQKYEQDMEQNLNSDENKNRGEIFISIETDQNENDPHPKNDPLVAANPSAQIEEVKMNDNKFQKIEDDEEDVDRRCAEDEDSDSLLRMRRINLLNDFPNVRLNNAKNLIQEMHEDFQEPQDAATTDVEDDLNGNNLRQITGSSLYPVDSDEISSIECYPVLRGDGNRPSGGRGGSAVQSKHSADSAYGSLSRQSPTTDINTNQRTSYAYRNKPAAATQDSPGAGQSTFQYPTSTPYKYSNSNSSKNEVQKYRCRNFSAGSSSSGSDNSLPPIIGNKNLSNARQEHQSQMKEFKRSFHRNPLSSSSMENKTQSTKKSGSIENSNSTNNLNPPSTPTLSSVKASKFCHECGSKFLLDQAKFCMDCGVRRIVLK